MVNRRTVTFGTLVLAALPAVAAASETQAAGAPTLEPKLVLKRVGDQLLIDLTVRNTGTAPADVLVAMGSRPAPDVKAYLQIEGEELELARVIEVDRREMMSRAGPRPRWAPIAAGEELAVGTYTYTLPEGVEDDERVLVTGAIGADGSGHSFRREGLSWRKPEA